MDLPALALDHPSVQSGSTGLVRQGIAGVCRVDGLDDPGRHDVSGAAALRHAFLHFAAGQFGPA